LIGQALAASKQPVVSATVLMRVPVQYPRQRALAAESLFLAAEQLRKAGVIDEAARIDGELIHEYPESALRTTAQQRLGGVRP
jgi:TolA-binding protein